MAGMSFSHEDLYFVSLAVEEKLLALTEKRSYYQECGYDRASGDSAEIIVWNSICNDISIYSDLQQSIRGNLLRWDRD